jgi:menaquinol-cytochrome c reductase iron-sulfur subunit
MERRTFSLWLVRGIGAAVGLVLALPGLIFGLSPALRWRRRRASLWEPIGPVHQFTVGEVTAAQVANPRPDWANSPAEKTVYVYRPDDTELIVFARNCTDLSCPVNYDPGSRVFVCPCHGGIFAIDGRRMAGPPRRPLFRYMHRVRGGVVEIDVQSLPPMV